MFLASVMITIEPCFKLAANVCVVVVAGFKELHYPPVLHPARNINIIKKCGILMCCHCLLLITLQ
jgi:hypothetical protein